MTLACEGNETIEAHKAILAATSDFFRDLVKESKHTNPLIYISGHSSGCLIIFYACSQITLL